MTDNQCPNCGEVLQINESASQLCTRIIYKICHCRTQRHSVRDKITDTPFHTGRIAGIREALDTLSNKYPFWDAYADIEETLLELINKENHDEEN